MTTTTTILNQTVSNPMLVTKGKKIGTVSKSIDLLSKMHLVTLWVCETCVVVVTN